MSVVVGSDTLQTCWDEMLNAMAEPDQHLIHAELDNCEDMLAMVKKLAPQVFVPLKVTPPVVEVPAWDNTLNIADDHQRGLFAAEAVYQETEMLTQPQTTTITTAGYIANATFLEEQLIQIIEPTVNIVEIACNFGRKRYVGYQPATKTKHKRQTSRRKQGNGKEFNSQLSCHVRLHEGGHVYKFKVFRNGKLQLPGITSLASLEDVLGCTQILVNALNQCLHPDEFDETKRARLIHLTPVMKNYKFAVKMDPNTHMIALDILRDIIQQERASEQIAVVKYGIQDTKLSIRFRTPIARNANKKTRVKVFMSGKINILGGLDAARSSEICAFMDRIFTTYRHRVIVLKGGINTLACPNIESSHDDIEAALEEMYPLRVFAHELPTSLEL